MKQARILRIFINRIEELNTLEKLVKGGSRVLVLGLRGYGKTTLLMHFTEKLTKKNLHTIYIAVSYTHLRAHETEADVV